MYQFLAILLILNTVASLEAVLAKDKSDRRLLIAESFTLSTGTTNDDTVTPSTVIKNPDSTPAKESNAVINPAPNPPSSVAPSTSSTTSDADVKSKAQRDVDFGPYMARLQKSIKSRWQPPKGDETKRVVVIFQIAKDGDMSKLRLDKTSGVSRADQAAMTAVKSAAPFKSLPDGAPDTVDIQFTFDYNVWTKDGEKGPNWYQSYSKRADVASWAGRAAKTAVSQIGPGLDSLSKTEPFNATLRCKVKFDGSATEWSVHASSGNAIADTKVLDYAKEKVKVVDVPPIGLPADETIDLGVVISREP